MKPALRALLLALLVAALPLRGYAGLLGAPCESHHGADAVQAHEDAGHSHEGAGDHGQREHGGGTTCSLCASCCTVAGLVHEIAGLTALAAPGSQRIPFIARPAVGFVLDHPDRPPLAT